MPQGPIQQREPRRRWKFGRHDRIRIDAETFVPIDRRQGRHLLRAVVGDVLQDRYVTKTDEDFTALFRSRRIRVDESWFSKAANLLKLRADDSDLSDLAEAELRTIAWKTEWCVRFTALTADLGAAWRPTMTPEDLAAFIENHRETIHDWYRRTFSESRPLGRNFGPAKERKPYDYPSASTLYDWLLRWRDQDYKEEAFKPQYKAKCGNRNQISPTVRAVIEDGVLAFAGSNRPTMSDVCERIEGQLWTMNQDLPRAEHITVSRSAIRRRIKKLDPFLVAVGRNGKDKALRRFTPVGRGLQVTRPLERIEMDDWEMDLQVLLQRTRAWRQAPAAARKMVPRVRCTVTVGIDCFTRTIVAFGMSPFAPSQDGSRAALRTMLVDKAPMAKWADCKRDWPMGGRPEALATDAGPAFAGNFLVTLRRAGIAYIAPDMDPRGRGTIEAFFRYFKRVCRFFTGQTFANVVEKGDYNSEAFASLTFEEIYKAAILFIVDEYHNRGHRGLSGGTPYARWERCVAEQRPPLSEEALIIAFGMRGKATLDKNGVTFLRLSYHSLELGALHRKLGEAKVKIVVDRENLGRILVQIPKDLVGAPGLPDGDYIVVPNVDGQGAGVTLVEALGGWKKVNEDARREQKEGDPYRYAAMADLLERGEAARRAAGLPSPGPTEEDLRSAIRNIEQKGRAGLQGLATRKGEPANNPTGGAHGYGEEVARRYDTPPGRHRQKSQQPAEPPIRHETDTGDPGAQRPHHRTASINMFEEDE